MSEIHIRNVFDVAVADIATPYEQKAVTAMIATALTVQGDERAAQVNGELIDLSQALGVAPTMTYEDLVFQNPFKRGDVYVMSGEPTQAYNEAAFYTGHREIEGHLAGTIAALHTAPDASLRYMDSAVEGLVSLHRQLGAEAFAGFRPYFIGLNGYAGPSGLFSAAIPTIDLLVHNGENMNQGERERMLSDLEAGLYPRHQSEALTDLLVNGSDISLSATVVNGIVKGLNSFRKVHRGSVRKFVPQALETQAAGSGGIADVVCYLASKMVPQEGAVR